MTRILTCTCDHNYQDEKYGHKKRVMNETKGGTPDNKEYRCTVCDKTRTKNEK